ncbi:MAG: peptide chain release factor N(5)-glutamine methyltransferase [Duncaniella sp.]|nr:peptide chain release factor N(5)-glutamine methyltransferase [Duncaniella sp.]
MTLRETVQQIEKSLSPRYGAGEARAMAGIIMEHLKGYSAVDLVLYGDREVSDFIKGKIDAVVERLLAGEPIQYIIGSTRWHGLTIKVTPDVLIPRPETSELVDLITDRYGDTPDLNVLDLCTGSGCIAIALARSLPFSKVTGVDISDGALAVARDNGKELKVSVNWLKADVLNLSMTGTYDIIVSNPPYVLASERAEMEAHVLDHEPSLALFVPDDDPLRFYSAILSKAPRLLSESGRIYFEINPLEASSLRDLMVSGGWQDVTVIKDIHGTDRFMTAQRPQR